MIILTFMNGILDINILNTTIVCIAITGLCTIEYLGIAGIVALCAAVISR
jgi:hypothetical protein